MRATQCVGLVGLRRVDVVRRKMVAREWRVDAVWGVLTSAAREQNVTLSEVNRLNMDNAMVVICIDWELLRASRGMRVKGRSLM